MRRAYNSNFLKNENDKIVGINLGADFCAEHEWGIAGIQRAFGLKTDISVFGIEKRRINIISNNLIFKELKIKNNKYFLLLHKSFCDVDVYVNDYKQWLPSDLLPYGDFDISCAWDERSFGILVSKEREEDIKTLYEAFMHKNIAIGIAPSHAFSNGGLTFSIISEMAQEVIDDLYEADKDYFELQKTVNKSGIKKILESASKKYFALSPRWKDDNKKEVIFWLNPMEQHEYNFGWFTIDDLKDWANNKGKIIKKKDD